MIDEYRFTRDQMKRLANILDNAGQVVFASVVIPPAFSIADIPGVVLWVGVLATMTCWWFSLRFERISS
jgi:hypothetical protein